MKTIRIGIPRAIFWDDLGQDVANLVEAAIAVMARVTAGAREVVLPPTEANPGIFAEPYAYHEERIRTHPEKFHPVTMSRLQRGSTVSVAAYIRGRRELDRARAQSRTLFENADLLVMPTAPDVAFQLGSKRTLNIFATSIPGATWDSPRYLCLAASRAVGCRLDCKSSGRQSRTRWFWPQPKHTNARRIGIAGVPQY